MLVEHNFINSNGLVVNFRLSCLQWEISHTSLEFGRKIEGQFSAAHLVQTMHCLSPTYSDEQIREIILGINSNNGQPFAYPEPSTHVSGQATVDRAHGQAYGRQAGGV